MTNLKSDYVKCGRRKNYREYRINSHIARNKLQEISSKRLNFFVGSHQSVGQKYCRNSVKKIVKKALAKGMRYIFRAIQIRKVVPSR